MSSGGANPSGAANGGAGEDAGDTSSRGSQRRRNKNCRANREQKFEGKCANLKNSVYDVVTGKDTFAKTT
jgi:hypothetical protein